MSTRMSQLSRNICIPEFPEIASGLRILSPLHSNHQNHISLKEASRPSTTSEVAFSEGIIYFHLL